MESDVARTEPFDRHSDAYDAWFDEHDDLYRAELAVVRQLLCAPGASGLEVGVGSGKFAVPLGITVGVEPSKQMGAKARALGIDVREGVAEQLPCADGSFDFVLMVTTVCFVDDVDASFREAFRVLRPGGCIVVGFVGRESELGRSYEAGKDESRFYKDATFFSSEELLERLERAGFRIDSVKQTLVPGKPVDVIMSGFGSGAFVAIRAMKEGRTRNRCP